MKTSFPQHIAARLSAYGIRKLARELGLPDSSVRRWSLLGYVPPKHLTDFCNALDIDLDLSLCDRDGLQLSSPHIQKPPGTLEALIAFRDGRTTIEDVAQDLALKVNQLKIIYANNKHRLDLLKETFDRVSDGTLSMDDAAGVLGLSKRQVHALMRKTFNIPLPERKRAPKSDNEGVMERTRALAENLAIEVIADRVSVEEAAANNPVSERTLRRYIKPLAAPYDLNKMSPWPKSFRLAFAKELPKPVVVPRLVEFAERMCIRLRRDVPSPKPIVDWRRVKLRAIMIAVLMGEVTLEEAAALRGGAVRGLREGFDGVLERYRWRFSDVEAMPVVCQAAIADYLLLEDHLSRDSKAVKVKSGLVKRVGEDAAL